MFRRSSRFNLKNCSMDGQWGAGETQRGDQLLLQNYNYRIWEGWQIGSSFDRSKHGGIAFARRTQDFIASYQFSLVHDL